jgi:hypothetical protein
MIISIKSTLQNSQCCVEYSAEEKEVFCRDLTDHYNEPAFYTKSKRGLKAAWEQVKREWTESTKLHDVQDIMRKNGVKTHYWCMMD